MKELTRVLAVCLIVPVAVLFAGCGTVNFDAVDWTPWDNNTRTKNPPNNGGNVDGGNTNDPELPDEPEPQIEVCPECGLEVCACPTEPDPELCEECGQDPCECNEINIPFEPGTPIYDVVMRLENGAVLQNLTWGEINLVCTYGLERQYFNIGDEKEISVPSPNGSMGTIVHIVGFGHDDLADGSGKASITFSTKTAISHKHRMNATNTNAGGWADSEMRNTTLGNMTLPSSVRNVLQPVIKSSHVAINAQPCITVDTLWLFSTTEIHGGFGSAQMAHPEGGAQYEYFLTNDTRRYTYYGTDFAHYWHRSTANVSGASNPSTHFFANQTGNLSKALASNTREVVFGFCVGRMPGGAA